MSDLNLIFLIIISLINLSLGTFVFLAGKKGATTSSFFKLVIVITIWSILNYLADEPSQAPNALFWNKATIAAGFIQCIAALYFILVFPEETRKKISPLWKFSFFVYGSVALISLITNLIVRDVEYFEWGTNIVGGKLYFLYFPLILFAVGAIIFLLIKKYKEFKEEKKKQIGYILIGAIIYLLTVIPLSVILPGITGSNEFAKFSPYAWVFFIFFTTLAITRYHLFGIEVILTEILVVVIGLLLIIQIFTTPSLSWKVANGVIFVLFCVFGYLLIRATLREIKIRREIEKIDKAKSEFISIASHQLKTPLTAVKGYISMILEGTYGQISEKMRKPLANVYQSNERLIKLVNDLLNLSKLEAGKIEFTPEPISLKELISGIIEELKINAEKKGLYLKIAETEKLLPEVTVDREKLRQVILNIVDNAIKYTQKGGVTIELEKINNEEKIKISDTGEGMTKEEIDSLFQMFSRATAGTQLHSAGAGLGLHVAKRFIEMHGGKIWAESPGKGKGSAFFILLPIKLEEKLLKTKIKKVIKEGADIF